MLGTPETKLHRTFQADKDTEIYTKTQFLLGSSMEQTCLHLPKSESCMFIENMWYTVLFGYSTRALSPD